MRRSLIDCYSDLRSSGVEVIEILSTRATSHQAHTNASEQSKQGKPSQEMSGKMFARVHCWSGTSLVHGVLRVRYAAAKRGDSLAFIRERRNGLYQPRKL